MKKTIKLLALSVVILTTSCQKDNTPSTPKQFKSFDISPIEINHAKEITSSEFIVRTNIDYTIIYDTSLVTFEKIQDSTTANGGKYHKYRVTSVFNQGQPIQSDLIFKREDGLERKTYFNKQGRAASRIADSLFLVEFYHATGGDNWTNNENWLTDKPLWQWHGIQMQEYEGVFRLRNILLSSNNLVGELPPSQMWDVLHDVYVDLSLNKLTGSCPDYIWRYYDKYESSEMRTYHISEYIGYQLPGYAISLNREEDVYDLTNHLQLVQLYKGGDDAVDLVITGDGFTAPFWVSGGYVEQMCLKFKEQLFSVEPFKSYKSHINIWMLKAVSKDRYISDSNVDRDTYFKLKLAENKKFLVDEEYHKEKVLSAIPEGFINKQTAELFMICHSELGHAYACDLAYSFSHWGNGWKPMLHELGHTLGRLSDEYVYKRADGSDAVLDDFSYNYGLNAYIDSIKSNPNFRRSMSLTSDIEHLPWKHYIGLPGYEMVGVYRGATYTNAYRSEYNSIMRNDDYFNTISREMIVREIYKKIGKTFDWQEFLKRDVIPEKSKQYVWSGRVE